MKIATLKILSLMLVLLWHLHAASLQDLLGNRRALQCYHNGGNDVFCKDLKSGKSWKVFSRSSSSWEKWVGAINRDGTKLTCNDGSAPVVINIDGSNKEKAAAKGTNCHFWRDNSGNDWVVYTPENESKGASGTTWRVKIDRSTNKPIESTREKIAAKQYSCGLNGSGVYLGETYGQSFLYNLKTKKQSPNLNSPQNCVGSMHPGDRPWMMYEENVSHQSIVISEWNENTNTARYIWRFTRSSGIYAQWSSSDDRYCVVLNDGHNAVAGASLDLVKISVDLSGSGDNKGSSQSASMGIRGMIGGPWIEPLSVEGRIGIRYGAARNIKNNQPKRNLQLVHVNLPNTLSGYNALGRFAAQKKNHTRYANGYYLCPLNLLNRLDAME